MAIKCNTCGATVPDNASICPYCGNAVSSVQPNMAYQQPNGANPDDVPSTGLNILSFIIPLAGWIMYFVKKDESPNLARSCSKWAWIGFGVGVFINIISALLID